MDPRAVGIPPAAWCWASSAAATPSASAWRSWATRCTDDALIARVSRFKELADKKKRDRRPRPQSLVERGAAPGDRGLPARPRRRSPAATTASLRPQSRLIGPNGETLSDAALGTGPVDAVYKAINRIVGIPNKLVEFTVNAITEGIDAIGEVLIRIESDGGTYTGRGASTDIVVASAKAYMNALNRLILSRQAGGVEPLPQVQPRVAATGGAN